MSNSKQLPTPLHLGDDEDASIPMETLSRLAEAVHIGELQQIDRLLAQSASEPPQRKETNEEPPTTTLDDA